jgi:hypothetical protein
LERLDSDLVVEVIAALALQTNRMRLMDSTPVTARDRTVNRL